MAHRLRERFEHLERQRRLARLPRARHHLHEAARLAQARLQQGGLRAPVRHRLFTRHVEYFYSAS
jgi:hypothetical protein